MDGNILGEEEIAEAVMQLQIHLSVMRDEHLSMWLQMATQEEHPDPGNWENVVAIIHAYFRGGEIAVPCDCQTVEMIPKGGGTDFKGIGLVEVMWKTIPGIIN